MEEPIPQQIYDLTKDEMVPNPAFKAPEPEPSETEEPESEEAKKPDAPEGDDKGEVKKDEPKPAETEESEEEEEEEGEEGEEPEKKEEVAVDADEWVKSTYGEKYELKNQADLDKLIANALDAVDELEGLKKEHDKVKAEAGQPKFSSDKQKKAFEFLSQYDIDRQGEALDTFAKMLSMDIDKTDGKLLMEEAFVHQHPELTRAEAQHKFNRDYVKKYELKKDSFDDEAAYNDAMMDVKIDLKSETAKAKSYLAEQKQKYTPKAKEDKPTVPEVITSSIKKNADEYPTYAGKQKEFTFEHDGEKYTYKLDESKLKHIQEAMSAWVKNPASYSEDGQLRGINKPDEMFKMVLGSLFLDDYVKAIVGQVKNSVSTKRVDEIGTKKVEKRSGPGGGDAKKMGDDLDEQAIRLIKKKAA